MIDDLRKLETLLEDLVLHVPDSFNFGTAVQALDIVRDLLAEVGA